MSGYRSLALFAYRLPQDRHPSCSHGMWYSILVISLNGTIDPCHCPGWYTCVIQSRPSLGFYYQTTGVLFWTTARDLTQPLLPSQLGQ